MKKLFGIMKVESVLYVRDFFGFFFTFIFPVLMLLLFGTIYGNEPTPYFNGLGTMDASVPAYAAMIIGVTGLMAYPLTLSSYKENRIYKRFDATPVGKGRIIAIQTLVNFCMTIAGFLILFTVGKLVYHIQVDGSLLLIFCALLLSIAAIFSLGFFFTAIAPTSNINNVLCYLSYFVMLFLSGSTMPKELFPDTIKKISSFLPLTHTVIVLQGTFRAAPLNEYKNSLFILAAIFIIFTAAGAYLYKRKSWV